MMDSYTPLHPNIWTTYLQDVEIEREWKFLLGVFVAQAFMFLFVIFLMLKIFSKI